MFPQVRALIMSARLDIIEHVYDAGGERPTAAGTAALARLDALVAEAAALGDVVASCGGWSGAQRGGALRRLDRLAGALATLRSGLVVAEQGAQGSVGPGDRDFVATRARMTRTGLGEARREVRQAETLTALPAVADAVGAGRVPLPHLDALARVAATAGDYAAAELARPETQARLVRMAERQSAREFGASAARLVASFDPAALERTVEAQRRARFLILSRQPEGTFVKGRLDHLSAEVLRSAIDSVGQAPDDERTKAQADADALVALAERAMSGTAGVRARRTSEAGLLLPDSAQDAADARVSGVSNRPTVSVLVPAGTFAELWSAQRRREAQSERSGGAEGDGDAAGGGVATSGETEDAGAHRPVEPAALEDGTPLAMSQLARVLCDSEVGRIVMSAGGVPLDLGRTERLYTGQQRRAVIVRDRQCAWNGCEVPAAYCEVHHIRWWDRDRGPTSIENGILLCSHHHHVVHQLDLTIVRLGRAPTRGQMLGEPVRYRFERRGGRTVNAPAVPAVARAG